MANPSDKSAVNTEKYEGPGKLSSAMDSGFGWASTIWALGISAVLSGKAVNIKALSWGSGVIGAVAAFFGYRSAAKGERQFESMKDKLNQSQMQVADLQSKVNNISREVSGRSSSFAHHVDSRTAHGSHASAAEADKAVAATAEAAR